MVNRIDGGAEGVVGMLETEFFGFGEVEMKTANDSLAADDGGKAIVDIGEVVIRADRKDAAFVGEDAVNNTRD